MTLYINFDFKRYSLLSRTEDTMMNHLKVLTITLLSAAILPITLTAGAPFGLNPGKHMGTANSVRYTHPKYQGFALDWCKTFEHGCGKLAADAFCKSQGHLKAKSWKKWNNPGIKTMTIGQNSICDPAYHRCDSFKVIRCVIKTKTFSKPKFRGYALDWCETFEHNCGKKAANRYCKSKGYNRAIAFTKWNNPGLKTMTIGESSICDPAYHRCNSFKTIKCKK